MATKKKTAKTTKKTAAGTISYTTSNVFNAPVAKVWAAATEKKHLKKHFVDDMRGEYKKGQKIGWFWKEWGWMDVEVVSYRKNKELTVKSPFHMGGKYTVTTRYEILNRKEDGKTIFRIHESGYPKKDLKMAFMMCEGWTEFHCGIQGYLLGVDLRKA
jgi:uncharacterized protein YndB with AHSA1/START domain